MDHSPKIIIPEANLRDIGGKKTETGLEVKTGYLFRSGHLSELSTEDFKKFKNLQLRTIVDVRRPSEIEKYPTPSLEKVETLNFSVSSDDNEFAVAANFMNGKEVPTKISAKIIEKYFKNSVNEKLDSYVPVFESLTDPDNFPLLFHCHFHSLPPFCSFHFPFSFQLSILFPFIHPHPFCVSFFVSSTFYPPFPFLNLHPPFIIIPFHLFSHFSFHFLSFHCFSFHTIFFYKK